MSNRDWIKRAQEQDSGRSLVAPGAPAWMHAIKMADLADMLNAMAARDPWPEMPAAVTDFRRRGQTGVRAEWLLICTHENVAADKAARFVLKARMNGIKPDRPVFQHARYMLRGHHVYNVGPVRAEQLGREATAAGVFPGRTPDEAAAGLDAILAGWSRWLRPGMKAPRRISV